jgi:hypothetical protein
MAKALIFEHELVLEERNSLISRTGREPSEEDKDSRLGQRRINSCCCGVRHDPGQDLDKGAGYHSPTRVCDRETA